MEEQSVRDVLLKLSCWEASLRSVKSSWPNLWLMAKNTAHQADVSSGKQEK